MIVNRRRLLAGAAGLALGLPAIRIAHASDEGVSNDEIRIGSYLPLQSGLAAGASQYRDGAAAYFQWLNAQGGINGRKITWTVENDSYNPQQTVAVVRKLVDREGVLAIVSTLGTTNSLAALPFLKQREIPLIAPLASHPLMNQPEDRIVFPISPLGTSHGISMAQFVDRGSESAQAGCILSRRSVRQAGARRRRELREAARPGDRGARLLCAKRRRR